MMLTRFEIVGRPTSLVKCQKTIITIAVDHKGPLILNFALEVSPINRGQKKKKMAENVELEGNNA